MMDVVGDSRWVPSLAPRNGRHSWPPSAEPGDAKPGINLDKNGRSVCREAQRMPQLSSAIDQSVSSTPSQGGSLVTATRR